MKYFWKLFFCIVLISEIIVGVAGMMVVHSGWNQAVEREIKAADQSNDMLFFYLHGTIEWSENMSKIWGINDGESIDFQRVMDNSVSIQTSEGTVNFLISDENGDVIGGERQAGFDNSLILQLQKTNEKDASDKKMKGYEIKQVNGYYIIHYARPFLAGGMRYYIENYRDVTEVFENQAEHIRILSLVMVFVFCIDAAISFLLATRKELKDYADRQEMFLANFEHELKTPLTSIIGYADMLRSKKMTEEQTVLLANQIVQEGKRLEVMSGKLMQLTVLKQQSFEFRRISAKAFLYSVYDTVYPSMQKANIHFTAEVQDGWLFIEPDLMKTVCINLLDNARKAIEHNAGKVMLKGRKAKKGYEIIVQDNGRGIPKDEIDKISEAFYMVDKVRSRGQGGAGLGLAVCTSIIKVHQGKIIFESKYGAGTRVRVLLMEEGKK